MISATGVSESWRQEDVNAHSASVLQTAEVVPKADGKLTLQMDELRSFVAHKGCKLWVWLALDADTRAVIDCHIDAHSRDAARAL